MKRIRVIPVLLLHRSGVYKTVRFSRPVYIGDPVNAVKIFNEKEVDELIVLDFMASREGAPPDFAKLEDIASEAFMPMGYGGGIRSVDEMRRIIFCGYEKVIVNSAACRNQGIIHEGARLLGSQSVVVSIDYRKNLFGRNKVYVEGGKVSTSIDPVTFAIKMEELGAGELILHSIDRDGTYSSYDTEMIANVSEAVSIPVIACGGAARLEDFRAAVDAGASAVAAGSIFVYRGNTKGILLNYPSQQELVAKVFSTT